MPYEDSPSSFLFGLNQFTSPPADSQNEAGQNSNTRSDSMLASLEAFASEDMAGSSHSEAVGGQAPNFSDQLALWTNANFSFDGPTGHALLGDEEKEKEEAEHNRRREDENRRNQEEERDRLARNAAASSRGGNALRGKAREVQNNQPESSNNSYPTPSQPHLSPAPSQQQHQPQHQQQQPINAFFPGATNFQGLQRPPTANNAPFPAFANGLLGFNQLASLQNAPQASPPAGLAGLGSLDMTSALALQHLLASNPLALASLSQLAGLTNPQLQSQLAGLVSGGGAAGLGAFGQQPQVQTQQHQPASNPANAASLSSQLPWLSAQSQATSRTNSISAPSPQAPSSWPSQLPSSNVSVGPTLPPSIAPAVNGAHPLANGLNTVPTASSVPSSGNASANHVHQPADTGASASASGSASGSVSKKKRTSTSEGKKPATDVDFDDSDDMYNRLDEVERRYEIPPLKLIDTGNPEADAEANRQAIEEDKRRRNTAASARFRIKKKQREAALEQTTKELQQRLADLEAENARLRTENGWLKSLITVRPDQAMSGGLDQSAVPNPFSAAAAAAAPRPSGTAGPSGTTSGAPSNRGQAVSEGGSAPQDSDHPDRQSGLHPRGVGTQANGNNKDANNSGSINKNNNSNGVKRDRED